jgi:DNA mismatch endonuclease, patch repair protein
MRLTGRRDTAPELAVRSALHQLRLRFRVDVAPLPGSRRRCDIVFPGARLAVFIDGCFWHACPEHASWPRANAAWWKAKIERNVQRDRDTDKQLQEAGWTVMRIWAHANAETAATYVAFQLRRLRDGPRSRP